MTAKRAIFSSNPLDPACRWLDCRHVSPASMSYKFKVKETFAEGFGRISAEQIDRASGHLRSEGNIHKGVHEARKAFKRLRSLLALYRGGIESDAWRTFDRDIRDISRALAGTREIQAMLDCLVLVEKKFGPRSNTVLKTLRSRLEASRDQAAEGPAVSPETLSRLDAELTEVGRRLAAVTLADEGFDAIRPGLEKTYRAARRGYRHAFEEGTGESFHEWRKALQRHWRQMQLLTPAWPHELRTRAHLLRDMTETIGLDHDLTVLDEHLAKSGRTLGTAAQVRACRAACRELQAELRASVAVDGQRLFVEGAGAFGKRLQRYWLQACKEATPAAREMPETVEG